MTRAKGERTEARRTGVGYEARARGYSSSFFDVMLGWVRTSTFLLRVLKKGCLNST
jgi:hypothetical protein